MRMLVAIAVLVSRVAFADTVDGVLDVEPGLPDRAGLPDPDLHLEGGFGVDLGRYAMGSMVGYGGLHGFLGLRIDRLAVLGELDGAILDTRTGPQEPDGGMARAALETRLSLWRWRTPEKRRRGPPAALVRAELWIEPALGYEHATQVDAPALQRRDVSFAIGYQQTRHEDTGWTGTYAALRVIAADAPDGEDRGRDYSIMFTSGVVLGR